jgi:anti-anti-sigma factor
MDTPSLTVAVAHEGRNCVLTITGDLDMISASTLAPTVTGLVGALNGQADRVVLDLAGLTFLDITGARALVAAVHAVPDGHPITLRSISPIARRLLGVLGWSLPRQTS